MNQKTEKVDLFTWPLLYGLSIIFRLLLFWKIDRARSGNTCPALLKILTSLKVQLSEFDLTTGFRVPWPRSTENTSISKGKTKRIRSGYRSLRCSKKSQQQISVLVLLCLIQTFINKKIRWKRARNWYGYIFRYVRIQFKSFCSHAHPYPRLIISKLFFPLIIRWVFLMLDWWVKGCSLYFILLWSAYLT